MVLILFNNFDSALDEDSSLSGSWMTSNWGSWLFSPFSDCELSVSIRSTVSGFGPLVKEISTESRGESSRWLERLKNMTYQERVKKHCFLSMKKTRVTEEESNFSLPLPRGQL